MMIGYGMSLHRLQYGAEQYRPRRKYYLSTARSHWKYWISPSPIISLRPFPFYYGRGKATFQSKPFSLKRDKKITISVVHLGMASLLTIAITVGHESCTMTFHSVPVKTNCSYCSFSSIT